MKLFRKAIRQRRLTRMRELLTEVMTQNNSENKLPDDGKIARGFLLVLELIIVGSLLANPDLLDSSGALILMGLFFPPFLLFGILLGMGTFLLFIGVIYLIHYLRVESYYQEFGMLYELAEEELSVYKQDPKPEDAERLQYYMEELKLETDATNKRFSK